MGDSSANIEALLVDVNDPSNPTPGMLPSIFRDIIGRLDAAGYTYAVIGHIALALHERARFVGEIEIVADFDADGRERGARTGDAGAICSPHGSKSLREANKTDAAALRVPD